MPRKEKENINYTIEDTGSVASCSISVDDLMREFESMPEPEPLNNIRTTNNVTSDYHFSRVKDYELNYNMKQLVCIYDYYHLGNSNKLKKTELAQLIVAFENEEENSDIVERRQTLWFYMNELKNDPYTKKFIWSP